MGQQDSTQVHGRRQEVQIQTKKTPGFNTSEGQLNTLNFFDVLTPLSMNIRRGLMNRTDLFVIEYKLHGEPKSAQHD